MSFGVLLIMALLALSVFTAARQLYPHPRAFEEASVKLESKVFPKVFWLYLAAVAFIAAEYVDFPLIAYHFKRVSIVSDDWIPVFYAIVMGVDALAALIFGRLFDRVGIYILIAAVSSLRFFPHWFSLAILFRSFGYGFMGRRYLGAGVNYEGC